MSKKVLTIIATVLVAGLLGFGAYTLTTNTADSNDEQLGVEQQEQAEQEIAFSQDGSVVSYRGQDGRSALEVLESLTTVETQDSDFGEFVVAINGVEAGEGQFWAFYVNGEPASEGAGSYITSSDDQIEWRLESF